MIIYVFPCYMCEIKQCIRLCNYERLPRSDLTLLVVYLVTWTYQGEDYFTINLKKINVKKIITSTLV